MPIELPPGTVDAYLIGKPVIIPLEDDSGWIALQATITDKGYKLSEWAIEFLVSGLRGFARCAVVEPRYICKDHANLHHHFYAKKFAQRTSHCCRVHFFSRSDIPLDTLLFEAAKLQEDYIGYTVVRPVAIRNLGVTIVNPAKIGRGTSRHYFAISTSYTIHLYGSQLTVQGFPYHAPDGDAMLCGHAALWSICRYLSERRSRYKELLPHDIISLTNKDQGRLLPDRATGSRDYSSILANFGTHPVIINKAKEGPSIEDGDVTDPLFRDLCTYVESGVPVLASFEGHACVLIGHTLDLQRPPVPTGPNDWLVDHSCFFDSLVVSDGNLFPYSRLTYRPKEPEDSTSEAAQRFCINDIKSAVCPLPERVYLFAASARNIAVKGLREQQEAIIATYGAGLCVTRLQFTTCSAFKLERSTERARQASGKEFAAFLVQLHLPHFIWIMEASPLESYKSGKSFIEIVLDASAGPLEMAVIYIRVGNAVHYSGIRDVFPNCPAELPLFTHNLGRLPHDFNLNAITP